MSGGDSSERDRKLISNLIARAVKRIHNASIERYEKASLAHVALAVSHERLLISSWVAGVFAELGERPDVSVEVQMALARGKYVEANDLMRKAIEKFAERRAAPASTSLKNKNS